MDEGPWAAGPAPREPLFRAPLVVLSLCVILIGVHATLWFGNFNGRQILADFALTSQAIAARRWTTLFSYMFLHAGWTHVLMNTGFALAFGAAPARLFGRGQRSLQGITPCTSPRFCFFALATQPEVKWRKAGYGTSRGINTTSSVPARDQAWFGVHATSRTR